MIVTATLLAILIGFLLIKYKSHAIGSFKIYLPSPPTLPLLGQTIAMLRAYEFWSDWLHENNMRFKSCWTFGTLFTSPYLVINDVESVINEIIINQVQHILKTKFENYPKGKYMYERFHDLLGDGIFSIDGHNWKIQRKITSNIFSVKNFKTFVSQVFSDESDLLALKLTEYADSQKCVDLQDMFFRFTLDSFSMIGFNSRLNCIGSLEPNPFAQSFDRAQGVIHYRFVSPFWKWEEWLQPKGALMRKDIRVIKEYTKNILKQRKIEGNKVQLERNDLLTLFLKCLDDNGDPAFSEEEISEIILNLIIAGRDTTAQAISWTFFMLSKHPQHKNTLLTEINEIMGDRTKPTYEDIQNMKFAKAVLFETLRLYPSVPVNIKLALNDDVLPNGTFVPKGASVLFSPYSMGRTTEIWGPDATEYKPQRWMDMEFQPSPFQFPAFNAGPRTCLGKPVAEMEAVYVIVSILKMFDYELVDPEEVIYANSLTLPMKNGLKAIIKKREWIDKEC